jgi:hypothetical protein
METFRIYNIRFTRRGETRVRQFRAADPGHAFEKCRKKFPDCIFLKGWREGELIKKGGNCCRISYAPPSTARIVAEPAPQEEQTVFCFLEEISLSSKKQDGDATSSILQPNPSHIVAETAEEKTMLRKRVRRAHLITGTFPAAVAAASTIGVKS